MALFKLNITGDLYEISCRQQFWCLANRVLASNLGQTFSYMPYMLLLNVKLSQSFVVTITMHEHFWLTLLQKCAVTNLKELKGRENQPGVVFRVLCIWARTMNPIFERTWMKMNQKEDRNLRQGECIIVTWIRWYSEYLCSLVCTHTYNLQAVLHL